MVKKRTIEINVANLNKDRRIHLKSVKKIARIVLKKLSGKKRKLNLNIIFVTDKYIKKLNKTYRHKNSSTDVLCFCMNDLGADVFISSDRVAANSKKFQRTFLDELHLYVIHGILHMLGFRDSTVRERRRMERTQERILKELI